MINALPFAIAAWAMFIRHDRQWSNQAGVAIFVAFYSLSLGISHAFSGESAYFVWSIASSPLFIAALLTLNKFTLMMLLLCLTEAALAIVDSVGFLTYNIRQEEIYLNRLTPEKIIIALQLAALMVKNGRPINIATIWDDMAKLVRNSATYFACVQAIQGRVRS